MDAIERRVIGFWFTRRHEGTKAGRQEGGLRLFSSQGFRLIPRRHCERSAAIQSFPERALDCRVAALLAMTEIAQEVLPARFLLTIRTVLVISRSTSSPCFPERRSSNGTLGVRCKGWPRKWSVRMEAASGMSLLKSSAHPSGKAFSLATG